MGIGDLAVPKRMQRFRRSLLRPAGGLSGGTYLPDPEDFENALARNILEGGGTQRAADFAQYARAAVRELDAQEEGALMRGELAFPSPEAFANARL